MFKLNPGVALVG